MRDVKLVAEYDAHGANYYKSKSNFGNTVIFDENCAAIEISRCKVFFNKPFLLGLVFWTLPKYNYIRSFMSMHCF